MSLLVLFGLDERLLVVLASIIYLTSVQLPTYVINIPLNNKLQNLNIDQIDETTRAASRRDFERTWNRWNIVRTAMACLTSVLSMIVLLRL